MAIPVRDVEGLLIDMDGVLYRGDTPVPGMAPFLAHLDVAGIRHLFVTNNSSLTPGQFADKLGRMGAHVRPERILTSALLAAAHLAAVATPATRVFVVGEPGLRQALLDAGLVLTESADDATHVVAGIDRTLSYEKLARATLALRRGAVFLGTNGDRTFPTERGLEPGAGAMLAALEAASGVTPQLFGKPDPAFFAAALEQLGTPKARTAMIGDRYETDILGAARAGLVTIAVTSGVYDDAYFHRQSPPPDFVFPSVAAIHHALAR